MRQWQSAFCRSIFRNWVEHFLSIYIFISNLYCGNVFMAIPHKNKKVNRQFYFLAKVTRYKMGVPNTCSIWMFGTWRFLVARSHEHRARFTLLLFVLLDESRKKKLHHFTKNKKRQRKKCQQKSLCIYNVRKILLQADVECNVKSVISTENCPSILNSEMFTEPNATMHQSSALTTQQHFHSNDI